MNISSLPQVALVGRPNVGKSTLYNRLVGKRQAVVADIAGTTRDRLIGPVSWEGRQFNCVDMAGIEPSLSEDTEIGRGTQAQVLQALQQADLVVWVVDARAGVLPSDEPVANILRVLNKPVIIAANKCDHSKHEIAQYEFARFGIEPIMPISGLNGRGVNDLLDTIVEKVAALPDSEVVENTELRMAIVGRPNVGKSTLLNTIVGEERSVVSEIAGTTRDSVDTVIASTQLFGNTFTKWETVRLIDTAGVRRRGKVEQGIEQWSLYRTMDAVDQAEVALLLIDAEEGMTQQDLHIAQRIVEAGPAMVLLVNKWDAILAKKGYEPGSDEDGEQQAAFLNMLRNQAPFLHWIQVLFLSAEQKINTEVIGLVVRNAYVAWSRVITQEELDEFAAGLRKVPIMKNLQAIVLTHNQPPVFHLKVEGKALPHFSTHRYAENALRDYFDLGPTPIKIWTDVSIPKRRKH